MSQAGPDRPAQSIYNRLGTPGFLPDPPCRAFKGAQSRSLGSYSDSVTKKQLLPFPLHLSHRKKPLTCRYRVPSIDLHCPFLIGGTDELDGRHSGSHVSGPIWISTWHHEFSLLYFLALKLSTRKSSQDLDGSNLLFQAPWFHKHNDLWLPW